MTGAAPLSEKSSNEELFEWLSRDRESLLPAQIEIEQQLVNLTLSMGEVKREHELNNKILELAMDHCHLSGTSENLKLISRLFEYLDPNDQADLRCSVWKKYFDCTPLRYGHPNVNLSNLRMDSWFFPAASTDNGIVTSLLKMDRKKLDPSQVKKLNKLIRRYVKRSGVDRVHDGNNQIFELAFNHYQRSGTNSDLKLIKALFEHLEPADLADLTVGLWNRYNACDHYQNGPPTVKLSTWQAIAEKFGCNELVDLSPETLSAFVRETQEKLREAAAAAKKAGKPLLFVFGEGHDSAVSWLVEQAMLEIAPTLGIKQLLTEFDWDRIEALHNRMSTPECSVCHWTVTADIFPTARKLDMSIVGIDVHYSYAFEVGAKKSVAKRDTGMAAAIGGVKWVAKIKGDTLIPYTAVQAIPTIAVVGYNHVPGLENQVKTDRFHPIFASCFTTDDFPVSLIFPEHMRAAYNALTPQQKGHSPPTISGKAACWRAMQPPEMAMDRLLSDV